MKQYLIAMLMIGLALSLPGAASAQIYVPPGDIGITPPPMPPPPPPPRIEVPVVPQMDASPTRVRPATPRASFGDRVVKCLDDAAAAGLGPTERAAYSRACANR